MAVGSRSVGDGRVTSDLRAWYKGRRVFVSGHTGFKGSWLAAWLLDAGAIVTGYSLPPGDTPNLFDAADMEQGMDSIFGDVRNQSALERAMRESAPEIVFHLAAQSLVRRSYREPVETYNTNIMGTVHLLDAARRIPALKAVVIVTSDKCYENQGLDRGYVEEDPMGGHDPYSSSKGCVELIASAYRRSFFLNSSVGVASARAGNVIGGGDWGEDRLVPDIVRAAAANSPAVVRNPDSVRPWQFVLDPLRGYLMLARALTEHGQEYASAWNFGPRDAETVAVRDLVQRVVGCWDRVTIKLPTSTDGPHEARLLQLDCTKARVKLGWEPLLDLDDTVKMTVDWYRAYYNDPISAAALMRAQLHAYDTRAQQAGATQ